FTEVFGCGSAAGVVPVGEVVAGTGTWQVGDGTAGPVARRLGTRLRDIQYGAAPDPYGWLRRLP
ncbi:MAG: branched-chain amino acid aminotransferase, partial [Streptomyces sp.]|nr:branched-chain amino acid aminotransferase [Streptomyces sp.]